MELIMSAQPCVLSVTSGKGGVGKTNISVNIACLLAEQGHKVLLLDADLGLANVDVLLGITPPLNLSHFFTNEASLEEIIFRTPYGFSILPASSGVNDMNMLSADKKMALLDSMDDMEDEFDYLIVDTGAGIHDNVLYFNIAAQEKIVLLTPEPTSLTDAYALIKVLNTTYDITQFRIIVNMADSARQGKEVFSRLSIACDHFLGNVSLDYIGSIPKDAALRKAVLMQKPFTFVNENSPASVAMNQIVKNICNIEKSSSDGNIKFFWKKLLFANK